jgi:hypothetical protein
MTTLTITRRPVKFEPTAADRADAGRMFDALHTAEEDAAFDAAAIEANYYDSFNGWYLPTFGLCGACGRTYDDLTPTGLCDACEVTACENSTPNRTR